MTSIASRKKSIISTAGISINPSLMKNTLASQSTSLYQQCSSLRARLMRIQDFHIFFTAASQNSARQSTDPVTQLWDCFVLGTSLCYLFNLLPPPVEPINIDTNPEDADPSNDKMMKRAIAMFSMAISKHQLFEQCEPFTVSDLWKRDNTDGFVKIVNTVIHLVDRLPQSVFSSEDTSSPPALSGHDSSDALVNPDSPVLSAPANAQEATRNNVIHELVDTERKYVQDLEKMQKYANALSQSGTVSQDTIHLLFPNLNKLLNFQRRFLIKMEQILEAPFREQRWGALFLESENDFIVYEPFCANYTQASELMISEEQALALHDDLINVKALPAFLIKPVQRICKYPLLLQELLKTVKEGDYPYYSELRDGHISTKRIADRVNEEQRRAENAATVKILASRVEDWKGHHLSNFGALLLDDIFVVTKTDVDREYHVFLFEKIILCCKEAVIQSSNKKSSKSGSMLRKQATLSATVTPLASGPGRKKTTPLLLKGRIFLNNVTQAVPNIFGGQYSLAVWWRGDDDLEYFTLRCRTEEQLRQWEAQINRLIMETASRRASERGTQSYSQQSLPGMPTSRAPPARTGGSFSHEKALSTTSQSRFAGSYYPTPYSSDEHLPNMKPSSVYSSSMSGTTLNGSHSGPRSYTSSDGTTSFEDDEFEDYPSTSSIPPSGRGTPIGGRRGNASQSLPPEQREFASYERAGGRSEDVNGPLLSQWRANNSMPPPPPPPGAMLPPTPAAMRPGAPRINSNASDASFGNGVMGNRPPLRSQFSSTKLRIAYENEPQPRTNGIPAHPYSAAPLARNRSLSNPQPYQPKREPPPPLPTTTWTDRSQSSLGQAKRGSGSSEDTGDSSERSPEGSSPITPLGSSDTSSIRGSHHPYGGHHDSVKVKVHFVEDIFVIQVARSTEYHDLVERVGKKIRLCGPRRDDGPLRLKYKDEDGDLVSLGSTEDIQLAFDSIRPGGQVTLYVT